MIAIIVLPEANVLWEVSVKLKIFVKRRLMGKVVGLIFRVLGWQD